MASKMALPIAGVAVEGFVGPYPGFLFGRAVTSNIDASPSTILADSAGIYSLSIPIDISYPISTQKQLYGYQVFFNGRRAYGWSYADLMISYDSANRLVLASTNQFAGNLNVLSRTMIFNVGGVTMALFSYAGTIVSSIESTGPYVKFTPDAGATRVTQCLPIIITNNQCFLAFPNDANLTRADDYYLRWTLFPMTTSTVGNIDYGIATYDANANPNPALVAARPENLSNPYQDPANQLNSIQVGTTGLTGTVTGGTTINVRIGSASYPLTFPYYFWVILGLAVIALIIFVIVLIVARVKTLKYVETKGKKPAGTTPVAKQTAVTQQRPLPPQARPLPQQTARATYVPTTRR